MRTMGRADSIRQAEKAGPRGPGMSGLHGTKTGKPVIPHPVGGWRNNGLAVSLRRARGGWVPPCAVLSVRQSEGHGAEIAVDEHAVYGLQIVLAGLLGLELDDE